MRLGEKRLLGMELEAIEHNPTEGHEKPRTLCRIERSHKLKLSLRNVELI
jgi:hypothetical protein